MIEIITKTKQEQGFTLVELMIVIAIIGILSAIAIPNFLSYQRKGYNVAANSDAMNYLSCAVADFAEKGTGAVHTLNCTDLPEGFVLGDDIHCDGSITQAIDGTVSGTMQFNHTKSSDKILLTGSSLTVKKNY